MQIEKIKHSLRFVLLLACLLCTLPSWGSVVVDNIAYNVDYITRTAEVVSAYGYSGQVVRIPETIVYSGRTCVVNSIGASAFDSDHNSWVDFSVVLPNGIKTIGDGAFKGCHWMTSINIPSSVTSIGEKAFDGCYRLKSINLPEGLLSVGDGAFQSCQSFETISIPQTITSIGSSVFSGCIGLTSVTIPNSVSTIGKQAFSNCRGLTSITLSDGVTSIGSSAFSGCSALTSVTIPNSVTSIGSSAFSGCSALTSVTIPNSVTSIGDGAFSGCSGLTSVTIPDGVTSIGYSVFSGCSSLTSVTIPDGVTSIEPFAFKGCSGLTSVAIPDGVISIGASAFQSCSSLTSVTIPDGVTSIGSSAFSGCSSLKSVTIPNSVTSLGVGIFSIIADGPVFLDCSGLTSVGISASVLSKGFNNVFENCENITDVVIVDGVKSIPNSAFLEFTGLASITIPNSVTSIGTSTFSGCTGLTSITIPNSVTSIGTSTFSGCTGLTSITIPNSVTTIGTSAFEGCTGLTSITIPNSVTSIGTSAFSGCSGLTSITLSDGVSSIGYSAFSGCSGLTSVTIPSSVTSIGYFAFSSCSGLTSITIPNSVTSIGRSVFSGCTGLLSAEVSESVMKEGFGKVFPNLENLTTVTLAKGVTSIYKNAFANCKRLESITLRSTVTSIGDGAFLACSGLKKITLPPSLASIGLSAFRDCDGLTTLTIPTSVSTIGNYAFAYCDNLESVKCNSTADINYTTFEADYKLKKFEGNNVYSDGVAVYNANKTSLICIIDKTTTQSYTSMPESVANIGKAFRGCANFTELKLSAALESIADSAFVGCTNLSSVTISSPSSLASIGSYAFKGCESLQQVPRFPSSLQSVGVNAFQDCTALSSVSMPQVTSIGKNAFEGCSSLQMIAAPSLEVVSQKAFANCKKLSLVQLSKVKTIEKEGFVGCSALKSISLPQLTTLADGAFVGCSALKSISLPQLTTLGDKTFGGCSALESVSLPQITTLPNRVFSGCSALNSVTCPIAETIGDSAFYGCKSLQSPTLSSNLSKIGNSAFDGCSSFSSPTEYLNNTLQVGDHAFKGCSQLKELRFRNANAPWSDTNDDFSAGFTIYVPRGAKSAYEATLANASVNVVEDYDNADLKALTDKYDEYYGVDWQPLITYSVIPEEKNVLSDASQLSANFIEEGEGSLSELLDVDDDTYFLSSWSQDNPTGENHFIQVDMLVKSLGVHLTLKRRSSSDELAPKTIKIYATDDLDGDWSEIDTKSLEYVDNVATVLVPFDCPMRYLRVEVTETTGNNRENDNLYFALAKLGVNGFRSACNPQGDGLAIAPNLSSYKPVKDIVSATPASYSSKDDVFISYYSRIPKLQNVVVTYQQATEYQESEQPQKLYLYYMSSAGDAIDVSYPYKEGTMGIIARKSYGPTRNFALTLADTKNAYKKRYLKNPHCYERPCKIDLLSEADTTEMAAIAKQLQSMSWARKTDSDYAKMQSYLDQIAYLSTTGRYADFINENYQTFYADYPAIVPNQVEAGIVKQQGDDLVIDYLYPEGSVIPANTAVILKGDCRGNAYIMEEGTTDATAPEGNLLHGTIAEEMTNVDGCNRYYKLSYDKATDWTLGFYWGAEGAAPFVNRPYKAFLALPESMNAPQMNSFSIADMEQGTNATSISQASSISAPVRKGIYSLDGRLLKVNDVKQLPVGVYIINGKKVIVK